MSMLEDSSVAILLDRLIDITLTYAIIIIVIAAAYPLLNKQLLETFWICSLYVFAYILFVTLKHGMLYVTRDLLNHCGKGFCLLSSLIWFSKACSAMECWMRKFCLFTYLTCSLSSCTRLNLVNFLLFTHILVLALRRSKLYAVSCMCRRFVSALSSSLFLGIIR